MRQPKRNLILLIFGILLVSEFFFSFFNSSKRVNILTKEEMQQIWAGNICGGGTRCVDWNYCSGQPCISSPCLTCSSNLKQRACVQSSPDPWICESYTIPGECGVIKKDGECYR